MTILLFGGTGMLGQAIAAEAAQRGRRVIAVSRHEPSRRVDLANSASLTDLMQRPRPSLVVNAAAMIGLDACEEDPGLAYAVNTRAVALMAEACRAASVPLVQISTDHYYTGDGDRQHAEGAPVTLVNEYARTKFAAEAFAARAPGALVVRTNIAGLRGRAGEQTFAEWAFDALMRRRPLNLFYDFHTSTIDTTSFSTALFDLVEAGATGTVNLAARTVASKRCFMHTLADALGVRLDWDKGTSVRSLATPRAESLGLDVTKAERMLGRALPDTAEVCRNLVLQWEMQQCVTLRAS